MSKRRTNKKQSVEPFAAKKTYVVETKFPAGTPNLLVVLRGLLLLAFDGKKRCEIGAVKLPGKIQERMPHHFGIRIWDADECKKKPNPILLPVTNKIFEINVSPPAVHDGIFVFKPTTSDPKDYSAVPDFEDIKFYGEVLGENPLDKNPEVMTPRVVINNGLVYCHRITKTKFKSQPEGGGGREKDLGSVADIVVIGVFLKPDGKIKLKNDGADIKLKIGDKEISEITPDIHIQVDVLNRCDKSKDECKHRPGSRIKERRNDFFLYYLAFRKPSRQPELMLRAKPRFEADEPLEGICHLIGEDTSDPAPCGPGGFGNSTGLGGP